MELDVTPIDADTHRVRVIFADRVAWEAYARRNGHPISPAVTGAGSDHPEVDTSSFASDTWHAYLAYRADTRGLEVPPGFSAWLDGIDSISPVPEDRAPRPTPPGPTPG